MRILGLAHHQSGCSYHRVVLPLAFMEGVTGYITNNPTDEIYESGFDIGIYNRMSIWDNDFDKVRNMLGIKIVVDLDDDWILPTNHLNYYDYLNMKPRIENNIRNADLVTCTNERLADKIKPFNSNVKVFSNAIPYGFQQFTDEKIESDKIRIFWCGGITHEADLEILKNPVGRLLQHKNNIKMVLGGYDDQNELSKFIWDKMRGYFSFGQKLSNEIVRSQPVNKYMELYQNADIMVIPLIANDWSACKSNLKILEAAAKKLPVICSAVEPYYTDKNLPVLWVHNQKDWFKHLNYLINNEKARQDYGERLHEYCKKNYNIFEINKQRKAAFDNLIKA
jgi:glycosyltransferase involved in cell wall biosynthesis